MSALLARSLFPVFRAHPFRGLGRLRPLLPVPSSGIWVASFPGGMRLRLDLAETVQRDYFFGMYERLELGVIQRLLAAGGDFVDVGAHIGFYTVAAAIACRPRCGRVLAFEPHSLSRDQLVGNLRLNDVEAEVVPKAVSDSTGTALLRTPVSPDISWSSLEQRTFQEGEGQLVETTTLDTEMARRPLEPSVIKIDVEGHELAVLTGARRTLADHRPVVVCEVSERTAAAASAQLADADYRAFRVWGGKLRTTDVVGTGIYNVLFVPREKLPQIGLTPC